MTIIFDRLMDGCMRVYIHTFSAAHQAKINEKLHCTNCGCTTDDWYEKLKEWKDKSYYESYTVESMTGRDTCITVFTFIEISSTTDFIQELNGYFYDNEDSSYAHMVKFQSIKTN